MTFPIRRALSNLFAGTLTLAVTSAGLLGAATLPAHALPTEQVAARLATVPVYVIGTNDSVLLLSTEENAELANLLVFMSQPLAEAFAANNSELVGSNQIKRTNLANIYLYQQDRAQQEQPVQLTFVPEADETNQARALNSEYPGGVPLFYVHPVGREGEPLPSVTPAGDGETVIPMFFSHEDLESELNAIGQADRAAREAIEIGVLPLEFLIGRMQAQEEEGFNRILLLPGSDTVQGAGGAQN